MIQEYTTKGVKNGAAGYDSSAKKVISEARLSV